MHPRLYRLTELHQRIDRALRLEQGRRFPNLFELMRLKKHKLWVKDRLFRTSLQLGRA